jgi:hypothetical protein
MPTRFFSFIMLSILVFSLAGAVYANSEVETLARQAVSENPAEAGPAIARLRQMGPEGLRILFEVYADEIKRHTLEEGATAAATQKDAAWQRLSAALDAVGQQRNVYLSRLYWYTDFEEARAAAQKSGKPILSLRLLGRLDEELSCANSRFFRTALYSNAEISRLLRERFILHWKTVRPAPRVTVDFGDGRRFESTITGNSIHYILDPAGRVIDALPGLYGPQAFTRELLRAETVSKQLTSQIAEQRANILRAFHDERIDALAKAWAADLERAGVKVPPEIQATNPQETRPPSARAAARMAMTKAVTENGIVNALTFDATTLQRTTDDAAWTKIAALHLDEARLDPSSIALMRRQNPNLKELAPGATTAAAQAELFSNLVKNFERYIALDTVRNEYWLHSKLHAWLLNGRFSDNVEALNEKVYAELFLTPRTDPWLGLYAPDAYTALDGGGISR